MIRILARLVLVIGLAFATALTVVSGAFAQEPEEVVKSLYAGYPQVEDPPGGLSVWAKPMKALWEAELARRAKAGPNAEKRPPFDFLSYSNDGKVSNLQVSLDMEGEGEAMVRVQFENEWGIVGEVFYGFLREGDDWRIMEVFSRDEQNTWTLSHLLKDKR